MTRTRTVRLFTKLLAWTFVPLFAGVLAAAILLGHESTLRYAADYAPRVTNGALTLTGVSGDLYGPFAIRSLHLRVPAGELLVEHVVIDWHPRKLFAGNIEITHASAARLVWTAAKNPAPSATDPAPPELPAIALDIARAYIGDIALRLPAAHYRVRGFAAAAYARAGAIEARAASADGLAATLAYRDRGAVAVTADFRGLDLSAVIGGPATAPPSRIDGAVRLHGTLTPAFTPADVAFSANFERSFINREPFTLAARGRVYIARDGLRLADVDVRLAAAQNRLQLAGGFGGAGDALRIQVDAPNLARLGPGFGGRAQARGALIGSALQPGGALVLDATSLRALDVYRLAHMRARVVVPLAAAEAATVAVRARDLYTPALALADMSLDMRGTRAAHTLTATAANTQWQLTLSAAGGVAASGWRGEMRALEVRRPFALRLAAPAPMIFTRTGMDIGPARLNLAGGELTLTRFTRETDARGARVYTKGHLRAVPVAAFLALAPNSLPLTTDVRVGGEWEFTLDRSLDGVLRLARERGDVIVATFPAQRLGLSALEVSAHARANRVTLAAAARGEGLGHLDARLETALTLREGTLGIATAAPLAATITATLPSLTWLSAFTSDQAIVGGRLEANLRAAGTLAAPQWQGNIAARALALRLPQLGLNWHSGEIDAHLAGERLLLERMTLRGGEGELRATGGWNVRDLDGDFNLIATRLDVVRMPGRSVVASGKGEIKIRDERLHVRGAITVDEGRIELPEHAAPTVSDDVVIVGAEPVAAKKSVPLAPQLDIVLDLGEKFYLAGEGLDVQLAGEVHVRADNRGLPRANGTVRVARGTYSAYGQRLTVERGVLTFSGPVDNPGLNILALRKNQAVQAGVSITGTARAPVVKLVSIPDVPDGDKISWLVLGHGLEESNKSEVNVLQSAAESLLARGESLSLQQKIAQRMGVDEFRFSGSGGLEQAVVTVGKRVSSLVYLTYEQGLSGTSNLLTVRYTLTPRWSLQTQTGRKDNAVDIFYTIAFD